MPLSGYLCPLDANIYGIDFLKFEIRDYDTGKAVYVVNARVGADQPDLRIKG